MIYLDTSSFLKLLLPEDHSDAVRKSLANEQTALISTLTELETRIQLRAAGRAGLLRSSVLKNVIGKLDDLLGQKPFLPVELMGPVFAAALRQHRDSQWHCRSLDRLHLAAMQELGVKRLMSHDARQIEAAHELGFLVCSPGG